MIDRVPTFRTLASWRLPSLPTTSRTQLEVSVGVDGGCLRLRYGPGASEALVTALASGDVPAPFRLIRFAEVPVAAGERPITADQTNESVVVGERLIVKWLPRPEPRPHPAPPVLAHLAEVGFAATAEPYAALSVALPDGMEVLLALVVGYLPDAKDGWEWCVEDLLGAVSDDPDAVRRADAFPAELDRLTAELHAAFATPSLVLPERRGSVAVAGLEARAGAALTEALQLTGASGDRDWLRAHAGRLRDALAPLGAIGGQTAAMAIHGDLHVGQVLRWRDGYAIVDFDGNPTVSGPVVREPAARDVAQMLTSLDHVGRIVDRRTAGAHLARIIAWIGASQQTCLTAYRSTLAGRGLTELLDERLLGPFMVEQECRELIYAARFLPRWRYAPMGTLRGMFPDPTGAP